MIVDMHTHFIDDPDALLPVLRTDMRNCGIDPKNWVHTEAEYLEATAAADRAVVFGLRAKATGWVASNKRVADFVKRHANRYVYFASIDPMEPDAVEQMVYEHHENGCRGIKLAPIYQGLHPMDVRYAPIYDYCQREGLTVLLHMGTTFSSGVPLEYARPTHIDEIACRYPELKLIIGHIAHPWEGETLAVIRRNRNVYADVAALYYRPWQFYNSMRLAVEYGCTHKLLFGSDYPATSTQASIEGVQGVNRVIEGSGLPPVPEEVLQAIIHRDSLTILGIEEANG